MDALPTLDDQIEAVKRARDSLVRSVEWRAGRKTFSPVRHRREVAELDAAIVTLTEERARRHDFFRQHTLLGPMK
jgi:hypothetical protein